MWYSTDHMKREKIRRQKTVPVPPLYESAEPTSLKTRFPWKWILVGLIVLFAVLTVVNKGWLVAATVDGQPVFRWQLSNTLISRYGQQTLEGMIGETLIAKEARKSGVIVTDGEMKDKQKEILSSLGTNVSLEDFLKFQGLSEKDFQQQLKIQLTVERLLTKDLSITEKDIDNYIATNRATLIATEPAMLRQEARKAIIGSVVGEKLQTWFVKLREKAKVMKFL